MLFFVLVASVATFRLAGGWALLPLCAAACIIPMQQRVVIASLDFDVTRIIILVGLARIALRGELSRLRVGRIDVALATWLIVGAVILAIREPGSSTIIYRFGVLLDGIGTYTVTRALVRGSEDLEKVVAALAGLALIVAPLLVAEKLTGFNAFSMLGGIPAQAWLRDGTIRAQGAFAHPIMAGSFGATLVPVTFALAIAGTHSRTLGWLGVIAGFACVFAPASSGGVLALGAAIVGWFLWPWRASVRTLRWSAVALLLVLHLVREKPVWHLIGRASDLVGGTGYHRYRLIDAFVANWSDWFIIGTNSTKSWGWGLEDLTNQFVVEGVRGGILTLGCFVALLALAFSAAGGVSRRARRAFWLKSRERRRMERWGWGMGVLLAVHCTSWLSVSYFGQMQTLFYLHLALTASLSGEMRALWTQPSRSSTSKLEGLSARLDETPAP